MLIFSADSGTVLPDEADEYTRLQSAKYALKGTFAAESLLTFAICMMLALVRIPNAYKDIQELGAWHIYDCSCEYNCNMFGNRNRRILYVV